MISAQNARGQESMTYELSRVSKDRQTRHQWTECQRIAIHGNRQPTLCRSRGGNALIVYPMICPMDNSATRKLGLCSHWSY